MDLETPGGGAGHSARRRFSRAGKRRRVESRLSGRFENDFVSRRIYAGIWSTALARARSSNLARALARDDPASAVEALRGAVDGVGGGGGGKMAAVLRFRVRARWKLRHYFSHYF